MGLYWLYRRSVWFPYLRFHRCPPGSLDLYVTMDGKAELNVYYTKMVPPYIIFKTDGSYVKPITAKAGEEIPQEEINRVNNSEKPPTCTGYTFAGWDWDGDGDFDDDDTPLNKMPEGGAVINAIWTPTTAEYTVEYWFQDVEGDGYTRNEGLDETRFSILLIQ